MQRKHSPMPLLHCVSCNNRFTTAPTAACWFVKVFFFGGMEVPPGLVSVYRSWGDGPGRPLLASPRPGSSWACHRAALTTALLLACLAAYCLTIPGLPEAAGHAALQVTTHRLPQPLRPSGLSRAPRSSASQRPGSHRPQAAAAGAASRDWAAVRRARATQLAASAAGDPPEDGPSTLTLAVMALVPYAILTYWQQGVALATHLMQQYCRPGMFAEALAGTPLAGLMVGFEETAIVGPVHMTTVAFLLWRLLRIRMALKQGLNCGCRLSRGTRFLQVSACLVNAVAPCAILATKVSWAEGRDALEGA